MQIIKYAFQQHGDERGMLVALEEYNDIPFEIKRVYYMYDTKEGVTRGYHAHKSLEQILICIHGSCKIRLDNGREKKIVSLEKPYEGLYVPNNMWREMYDFSPDAVLMVLASEVYKEEDYIRDYDTFLKLVKEGFGACRDIYLNLRRNSRKYRGRTGSGLQGSDGSSMVYWRRGRSQI